MRRSSRVLLVVLAILGALLLMGMGMIALLMPRPVGIERKVPATPVAPEATGVLVMMPEEVGK